MPDHFEPSTGSGSDLVSQRPCILGGHFRFRLRRWEPEDIEGHSPPITNRNLTTEDHRFVIVAGMTLARPNGTSKFFMFGFDMVPYGCTMARRGSDSRWPPPLPRTPRLVRRAGAPREPFS